MSSPHVISQRDLRTRSKQIMDAVEAGEAFTVTRDGREIGELAPLRRKRRFVPREEFAAMSKGVPALDSDAFLADIRNAFDDEIADPYAR